MVVRWSFVGRSFVGRSFVCQSAIQSSRSLVGRWSIGQVVRWSVVRSFGQVVRWSVVCSSTGRSVKSFVRSVGRLFVNRSFGQVVRSFVRSFVRQPVVRSSRSVTRASCSHPVVRSVGHLFNQFPLCSTWARWRPEPEYAMSCSCGTPLPSCARGGCTQAWVARAHHWHQTSGKNWHCPACSLRWGWGDPKLWADAREWCCSECLTDADADILLLQQASAASSSAAATAPAVAH